MPTVVASTIVAEEPKLPWAKITVPTDMSLREALAPPFA
jgi:hypothetical protein